MSEKFTIGNLFSFDPPYMWIGFVVGFVVAVILYMWVIKPGVKRCVKDYPNNCTDKANLIPAAGACKTGTEDTCRGGYTCVSSGGTGDGAPGTCTKD